MMTSNRLRACGHPLCSVCCILSFERGCNGSQAACEGGQFSDAAAGAFPPPSRWLLFHSALPATNNPSIPTQSIFIHS